MQNAARAIGTVAEPRADQVGGDLRRGTRPGGCVDRGINQLAACPIVRAVRRPDNPRPMRFAVALTALLLALPATAQAAGPTLGADGETAATYDYASAIRERVFIPQTGGDPHIAVDVIRPNAAGPFPTIVDASPYWTSVCRGLDHECLGDPSGDGKNDLFPLFVDNYFVPRG